jgi:hypothetical protein
VEILHDDQPVHPGMPAMHPDSARRTLTLVETSCVVCGADEKAPETVGRDFEHDTVSNEFCFVRCRACGHLYLDPRPALDDLPAIYPASYYAC